LASFKSNGGDMVSAKIIKTAKPFVLTNEVLDIGKDDRRGMFDAVLTEGLLS
jgi:hypothetical protein